MFNTCISSYRLVNYLSSLLFDLSSNMNIDRPLAVHVVIKSITDNIFYSIDYTGNINYSKDLYTLEYSDFIKSPKENDNNDKTLINKIQEKLKNSIEIKRGVSSSETTVLINKFVSDNNYHVLISFLNQ